MSGMLEGEQHTTAACKRERVTPGNHAKVVAVGILALLCQACAGASQSSRPAESTGSREATPVAPTPGSKPETPPAAEAPPPARPEPPKTAAPAPEVAPSPKPSTKEPQTPPAQAPPARTPQAQTPPAPATPPPRPPATQAPPKPSAPAPAERTPAAAPAAPAKAPTLDLGSLEQRLRDTKAIGVFTKLSLKNQVDDLLDEFRDFHKAHDSSRLTKLRQAYDLLLMKVLSLLQDGDPALARDVSSSREALWSILVDPDKFRNL
jgi:hypothetical protein